MKTYSGSNAGSQIEPVLWSAKESIWIVSPYLGNNYAKQLAILSQRGIEVRIITSNAYNNLESLETLKASENPNLRFLVLDKDKSNEKAAFVHSKIYIVDRAHGISGSANLTYSGFHSNVESLNIAETKEEVQQIEMDFRTIWMDFERKGMSKEELSSGTSYSIRNALPLLHNLGNIDKPNIKSKQLVYYPYYFFEYSFRVSVGTSPPRLFKDNGFIVLDAVNRQIINDALLVEEIENNTVEDYVLRTENKYSVTILPQKIESYQEARELVLNYIVDKNTQHYTQYYGSRRRAYVGVSDYRNRSYDKIFVLYRNAVSFTKSGFVQVPTWYVEIHEPNGRKHQDIVFGSSGRKWNELLYCPECQKKIWINQAVDCKLCGKQVCPDCINEVGLIFKKKLCSSCLSKT